MKNTFGISYQPTNDPLLRSSMSLGGPIYKELFRPSQSHPTVLSARIAKYLIAFLSKKKTETTFLIDFL